MLFLQQICILLDFGLQENSAIYLTCVGQVVKKMTRESYLKSIRNPSTFNKSKIEEILVDLFSNDLGIDKSKLTREAKLS
ncbi:hypothetical protein [uncultured Sphingobacterium sp.]|uniref:hypothetical protein n=1 Tax=uncultured Sphingobacterium sp. TaxID=182688 RepID=UPI0025D1A20A|nr:hypothetical protein [uncultured Sphingobacterium sp.]